MYRYLVILLAIVLAGCASKDKPRRKDPVIGQAFAGPITLVIRQEVNPRSKPAATVKHGDKLDILQVRRRFVRVRTEGGQEGWTDSRQLLSVEQMEALQDLSKDAAKLPSQGEATVYEALNIHTEPNRLSTSFYQLTEGKRVDLVGHRVMERATAVPKTTLQVNRPAPPARRKKRDDRAIPPPPRPDPPALPKDWQELSKSTLPPRPELEKPRVPLEDWALVRTKDGKAGWVLMRNLVMAIPDEVAQYSEGARITSYFALAPVQDGDQTKHHWLWTTTRATAQPYEFDSFRVFIYMLRRHRYETAYIERGVEGHYPVEVTTGASPKFSLILRGKDGQLYKKTWQLDGYNVRKVGEQVYQPGKTPGRSAPGVPGSEGPDEEPDDEPKPSWLDRLKKLVTSGRS